MMEKQKTVPSIAIWGNSNPKEMKMKKIMMIIGLILCAYIGVAQDTEWKDASEVDLSVPSPAATMVKAVNALNETNRIAYVALLTDTYKKTEPMHYKAGCNALARCDLEKGYCYKLEAFSPEGDVCYVQVKLGRKGKDGEIRIKFKIVDIDGKFLISGS